MAMNERFDKSKDFDLVAWKERSLFWTRLFGMIFFLAGFVGMLLFVILGTRSLDISTFEQFAFIFISALSLVCFVIFAYYMVKFIREPLVYIVLQEGMLYIEGGIFCEANELTEVCSEEAMDNKKRVKAWGVLTVKIGDTVMKYSCVAKVQKASERLLALKEQKEQNND